MEQAAELRRLLDGPDMLVAPGAYDALGAMLVEQAGFAACYMTGAGTSVSRGYPDFGLLTMSEMVDNAARMAESIGIPLIADADTGYGNELNVTRTVREYEARGIAGLHIEDQVSPKRCGHLAGKEVVPAGEFVSKIRAAAEARRGDLVLIARTDARQMLGFDEAIARANAALAAGADVAFVEATQTEEEAAAVPKLVDGPCLLNVVGGGRTPVMDLRVAADMGYRVAILPTLLMNVTVAAADAALAAVRATSTMDPDQPSPADVFRRVGADEWDALRARFGAGAAMT
ncbi:MAG: isocitrate lyase/PEP mutase family protein [Ilumatobacteraceae bacterium]